MLIASGWKPNIDESLDAIGLEILLREHGANEVQGCIPHDRVCIFYYTKPGKCLVVTAEGDEVNHLTIKNRRVFRKCPTP